MAPVNALLVRTLPGWRRHRNLLWFPRGIADDHGHVQDRRPDPDNDPQTHGSFEDLPARRFGWSDMFVHPDDDPRTDGGFHGERATLVGYLRDQRLTLELKCSGLDAADLARRSVEPSSLSLLGLVRHMAEVERSWFRRRLAGQDAPPHYRSDADPDGDFDGAVPDPEVVADAWGHLASRGRVRGAVRGRGA
jgi:Protein of unknown function (DUF664)